MGGYGYSTSRLAQDLHLTPRVTFQLEEAPSQFEPDDRAYEEGLASIVIAFLIFALVMLGVFTAIVCCSGEVGDEEEGLTARPPAPLAMQRRKRCVQWCSFLAVLVCAALIGALFIFEVSVKDVQTDAASAVDRFNGVVLTGDGLALQLNHTGALAAEIAVPDGSNASDAQQTFVNECAVAQTAVQSLVDAHASLTFNMTTVNSVVDDFERFLMYGAGGIAALFALPACGLLLGACARSATMMQGSAYVAVALLLVILVLSGLEYAASVGLADFCVDPNAYVLSALDQADSDSAVYYVNCTATTPSPFADELADALHAVNESERAFDALNKTVIDPRLAQVYAGVQKIVADIGSIEASVACDPFHQDYQSGVETVCFRSLHALFASSALYFALAVFISAAASAGRSLWPLYRTKAVAYTGVNTEHGSDESEWFLVGSHSTQPSYGTSGGSRPDAADIAEAPPWYEENGATPEDPPPSWHEVVAESGSGGVARGAPPNWARPGEPEPERGVEAAIVPAAEGGVEDKWPDNPGSQPPPWWSSNE